MNSAEVDWAAVEARWQLEAELRAGPPRRVIARAPKTGCGARIGNSCLGCALTGMLVLGFFLSLWAGLAVLILPFGNVTQGTITQHELTRGRSPRYGNSESYMLQFAFAPNGNTARYSGEWPVDGATFLRLRDGDETTVRYFPLAPGLRPILEEGVSPWLHILFMGPLGLLMLAIGGAALTAFLPPSRADKPLVKRGIAAPGLVIERANNRVQFWFRVANAQGETRTIEATRTLANRSWSAVQPGEVATILFDARRPQRALIYRMSAFRAR